MSRIAEFIKYLESHIGDMYVWGAQGQCVSGMETPEAWITGREKKNGSSYVARAVAFFRKAAKRPLYAFDCSGLIMYWFQQVKGWSACDRNANGLYGQCTAKGKLGCRALSPGDLVFIHKGLKKVHVGVYVGNGCTIEAYGRDLGVCKRRLADGAWTHQGTHPYLAAEDAPVDKPTAEPVQETAPVATVLLITSPLMRGEEIAQLQSALNGLGYPCGAADGICGRNTMAGIRAFAEAHKEV